MPTAPLRPCATARCPNKVRSGHCAEHSRQREQARGSQRERGYTRRWEQASRVFKARYPLCGMRPKGQPPVMSRCHDEGRVTAATVTDHVIPHRGDQALMWDEDGNWQSLCSSCHSRKTATEDGGFRG